MNSGRRNTGGSCSRRRRRTEAVTVDKRLVRLAASLVVCALGFGLSRIAPAGAEKLGSVLDKDTNFEQVFSRIGRAVADDEGMIAVFRDFYKRGGDEADAELPQTQDEPTDAAEEIPVPQPLDDSLSLEQLYVLSQSEYAYLGTPELVSTAMPDIGFAFTAPAEGELESGFGYRLHPVDELVRFHYGVDISAEEGEQVYAFAGGRVLLTAESTDYGKYVQVAHEDGWLSLYAHLSEICVSSGDELTVGQVVGCAGSTGNTTGTHLHFELLKDELYVNPAYYIAPESICALAG